MNEKRSKQLAYRQEQRKFLLSIGKDLSKTQMKELVELLTEAQSATKLQEDENDQIT